MYRLIDKLYLNFYWCWNTDKNGKLKDVTLSKDIMILLWAILFIAFSPIIPFIPIKLSVIGFFACIGGIAFMLTELIMLRYNEERTKKILDKYEKPGNSRFVVFALFTIISVLIVISSFFIGSKIIEFIKYNRLEGAFFYLCNFCCLVLSDSNDRTRRKGILQLGKEFSIFYKTIITKKVCE